MWEKQASQLILAASSSKVLFPETVLFVLMIVDYAMREQCFCESHPRVVSVGVSFQFVYFRFHAFLWGNRDRDKIIFLHCNFRSFGHQQIHIQPFENHKMGAERVFLPTLHFTVDFTDLMMTSSLLPPTQRHTENLCLCIFYISWRYRTAAVCLSGGLQLGFFSALSHVTRGYPQSCHVQL